MLRAKSNLVSANGPGVWWLNLMGRLKPGATYEQARASLNVAFQRAALQSDATATKRLNCRPSNSMSGLSATAIGIRQPRMQAGHAQHMHRRSRTVRRGSAGPPDCVREPGNLLLARAAVRLLRSVRLAVGKTLAPSFANY